MLQAGTSDIARFVLKESASDLKDLCGTVRYTFLKLIKLSFAHLIVSIIKDIQTQNLLTDG